MSKQENPADGLDERYLVPALMRGLEALRAFSRQRQHLSLSDLAASIGVTRSSAYRLVYTLDHLGFLVYDQRTRTYALGPQVLELGFGYLASRDLVEISLPHLEHLRDSTNWSAHLAELHGTDALYLARVPTRRSVDSLVHVGSRLPAHATAIGRMLLSALPERDVLALYSGHTLQRFTNATLTSVTALIEQLRVDRANGFVVDSSGYETGVAGVAAPVRDATGRVLAAINVAGVVPDVADIQAETREAVVQTAAAISRDLGSRRTAS